MAKPTKRRIEGTGSVAKNPSRSGNPKVAAGKAAFHHEDDEDPPASTRYTPPTSAALHAPSPMWVPIVMFTFFGLGFLVIFLNYTSVLPSSPSGWYLIGGLGAILAGIITATQLR